MQIDITKETLRTLKDAGKRVPGKPRCLMTMHRWRLKGVKGVKLECVVIGNIIYTSDEAMMRFFAALNSDQRPTAEITPAEQARRSKNADIALAARGL